VSFPSERGLSLSCSYINDTLAYFPLLFHQRAFVIRLDTTPFIDVMSTSPPSFSRQDLPIPIGFGIVLLMSDCVSRSATDAFPLLISTRVLTVPIERLAIAGHHRETV